MLYLHPERKGRMLRAQVNGRWIAYQRAGEGPLLVLLHGFVGDSREWRRQIHGLSDEFTVVAWDAPGSGRSSDPPESFRLPDFADCLAEFVDAVADVYWSRGRRTGGHGYLGNGEYSLRLL